jgi:hypothetical protein
MRGRLATLALSIRDEIVAAKGCLNPGEKASLYLPPLELPLPRPAHHAGEDARLPLVRAGAALGRLTKR